MQRQVCRLNPCRVGLFLKATPCNCALTVALSTCLFRTPRSVFWDNFAISYSFNGRIDCALYEGGNELLQTVLAGLCTEAVQFRSQINRYEYGALVEWKLERKRKRTRR
jgi:hypothetical protein